MKYDERAQTSKCKKIEDVGEEMEGKERERK